MKVYTAIALNNLSIVLSVAAISLTGLLMFQSFNGLWSMLMLFFMASGKSDDK